MFFPKVEEKHYHCHKCKQELEFEVKMQRTDTCPHCGADLHVCMNCEFWDPGERNQCREHISEYVPDRERTNYCTFFTFLSGDPEAAADKEGIKAKLDSLFDLPKK
ncbi:MAG: hypothetical protein JRG91_10030 [Deltaproteobacteria bacterium]|nr:hypothetical protein [Deltaproteobacteria bacterium]